MKKEDSSNQFLLVIETNKGILYKIANSYCKDKEDRKDLIQEIIIQLWKSFENYDDTYKYSTWIYRIALNVAISFYRKEKSRGRISNSLTEEIFITDFKIEEDIETNLNILQGFIHELKELDRALILLYLEEKSHKEISEIIGISETNVATKIGRIKLILKNKFSHINNQ